MTLNFTVGPVQSPEEVCKIGGEQVPYFRTAEFSEIVFENEKLILNFLNAPQGSKVIELTGSGTAAMEASVMNLLNKQDKVLVINGGSFGQRFVDICSIHGVPFTEIDMDLGKDIKESDLAPYDGKGYTGFLVNMGETSTGVRYDMQMISDFCRRNKLLLIVDAISTFLADPIDMTELSADAIITSSQKALACHPGLSLITLSPKSLDRLERISCPCLYFDFKSALKNAERGQTPFTPAVSVIRQINARLKSIESKGGIKSEVARVQALAEDFRSKIRGLPVEYVAESKSNAVTALRISCLSANDLFLRMKSDYDIWICPNGGAYKEIIFRVGHIGDLSPKDNDTLVEALKKEILG